MMKLDPTGLYWTYGAPRLDLACCQKKSSSNMNQEDWWWRDSFSCHHIIKYFYLYFLPYQAMSPAQWHGSYLPLQTILPNPASSKSPLGLPSEEESRRQKPLTWKIHWQHEKFNSKSNWRQIIRRNSFLQEDLPNFLVSNFRHDTILDSM